MVLNDGSTTSEESDPRYVGIIIPTLRDYFEDYINEEQVVDSQEMVAIVCIVMGSRKWRKEKERRIRE